MFAKNQLEAASGGGGACRAGGRVLHGADLYPYVGCHRQHINTLVLFIGSVGIIGSACVAVGAPSRINLRAAVVIITLLVLVRLVMQPVWLADITAMDNTVVTFPHAPLRMLEQLRTVHLLSWCVSVVGMLCFAAGGLKAARGPVLLGSALLIVGELMLRFVFFSIG